MFSVCDLSSGILRAAANVRHAQIYLPDKGDYVTGLFSRPVGMRAYRTGVEPEVDTSQLGLFFKRETAWLSVNRYNAVVLNSRNMLIADVDFGDRRLSKYAVLRDEEAVIESLEALEILDSESSEWVQFAEQSYRVYRTHSGCRVICTSRCFPWGESSYSAERFMRFLGTDPEYVRLCQMQKCFRARLTPKPWRSHGASGHHVCKLVYTTDGKAVHPDLADQLQVHDAMTLATDERNSTLA